LSARRLLGRTEHYELALGPYALSRELWSSWSSLILSTPLVFLPLHRAGRLVRLWFLILRNGPWRIDASHHRDRCRITGLAQVKTDKIARLSGLRARRPLTVILEDAITCHTAAVGAPHRDRERENKIVVFAGASVEGQMTSRAEFDPKIL
jgi:hypothetical protein